MTFILWNELRSEISRWQRLIVLSDFLPDRPFMRRLAPAGYTNIYNILRAESILKERIYESSPAMRTQVQFVRLYELLSSSDGQTISPDDRARLLHDGLNSEIVLDAVRSDLHQALGRDDIEKMLCSPAKSLGLML